METKTGFQTGQFVPKTKAKQYCLKAAGRDVKQGKGYRQRKMHTGRAVIRRLSLLQDNSYTVTSIDTGATRKGA